ncbi:MAG: hypothetical protein M1814_005110 [Vezdaea aestivalis]|nr:MAG: hypothetical protein M1814_005110 [Vezdaea aestivalis]
MAINTKKVDTTVERTLDLSVGIEVEFFATIKKSKFKGSKYDMRRFIAGHIQLLKLPGLSVFVGEGSNGEAQDYTHWTVTNDHSIDPSFPDMLAEDEWAEPIELISKAYAANDPLFEKHLKSIFAPLPKKHYRGSFKSTGKKTKIQLNGSTNLHVHIGMGKIGFSVPHLKRLAALCLLFEEEIDRVLDDHVGFLRESPHARSNLHNVILAEEGLNRSPSKLIERLRAAKSTAAIADIMCPAVNDEEPSSCRRYYKYNFMSANVWTISGRKQNIQQQTGFGTVEFRQHQGSVNGEEIFGWVKFLLAFVKLSEVIPDEILDRFVETKEQGGTLGLMSLFAAMAILAPDMHVPERFMKRAFGNQQARSFKVSHLGLAGRTPKKGLEVKDWLLSTDEELKEVKKQAEKDAERALQRMIEREDALEQEEEDEDEGQGPVNPEAMDTSA